MQLDFALGKAYGDLKDYRRSFTHLLAGNAAKRATISYDEASVFALFDRIEATFTRELIAQKSGGGDPSRMPIFVIGMPRSGTTLIEQIIASHPLVHGAGELQTFNDVVLTVRGPDGNTLRYPEFVPALDAAALRQIGARYIADVRKLAPSGERVTDKMPSNYYFAGLIHLALPNAKIIHSVRNPVDTCISCFSKLFTAEQNHTYDLAELGRYYKRYETLMAHWRRVLPAKSILDMRYEDVVADLERAGAPHHRLLRPALGRPLPVIPRNRAAGANRERDAGASADLQERRRPLAGLRGPARAAVARAWHRRDGQRPSLRTDLTSVKHDGFFGAAVVRREPMITIVSASRRLSRSSDASEPSARLNKCSSSSRAGNSCLGGASLMLSLFFLSLGLTLRLSSNRRSARPNQNFCVAPCLLTATWP